MKKTLLSFLVSLVFLLQGFAQESTAPTRVEKAAIFDKSPPLRDMPQISPSTVDNSWKEGIIENGVIDFENSQNKNAITDPSSIQSEMGILTGKGPIVNVEGTGNVNGVYPPDTDGDVSPDHYMQMINLSFAIYDKNGTKLYGPVANSTLWSGFPGPWSGTNDGDPIILYDEMADRWVASQFAVWTSNNKYYELIAVSETSDPLGSWYRYAFEFDDFPDYPKLSVWPDGYYATFHMFSSSLNYLGGAFVAFEREKMLIGDPDAQMIYYGEYSSRWGYLPADVDGDPPPAGTPCYFAGINFSGNQNMLIYEFNADWDNTSNSSLVLIDNLNTDSFSTGINGISQPGTSNKLDEFVNRLMFRLPYRNFGSYSALVANHTVNSSGVAGIRWYELRDEGSGWDIYQQGTYSPDNEHRWMGSIAMGADGSIALGYSVSSSSTYPSIRYTGRTPNAPLGEMDIQEIEIVSGGSSQTGIQRWGDYSCMSVDPSEEGVFWFTTEYMKPNGWGTRICSFDFNDLLPPTANAGDDETICSNSLFEAQATAQYYSSVQWETSGDGIFQNANTLNAKYLRGDGDIENGGVTLTLTTYGFQAGWEATDDVYVTIIDEPNANAGNDTTIHFNQVLALNASADNASSVEWSTSGDGAFDDETSLTAVYTPGSDDISNGEVELTLTAYAIAPCEDEDTDKIDVVIDPTVGIIPFTDDKLSLEVVPNPSDGNFSVVVEGNSEGLISIKIRDLAGTVIYENKNTAPSLSNESIDLSSLPKGIYLMEVSSGTKKITEKVVIR